jgi:hypothetical protein
MTTKLSKITYTAVKPVVEALKEGARVALIAVIPLLIEGLGTWSINWRSIAVVGGIALLRVVDKYLHLEGKLEANNKLVGGLTRF